MGKMGQLHADTAAGRAADAEHDAGWHRAEAERYRADLDALIRACKAFRAAQDCMSDAERDRLLDEADAIVAAAIAKAEAGMAGGGG